MKFPLRQIRAVLVFLLFLELFFWVGGWINQGLQYWGNMQHAREKGVYRIVCIGESLTMVGGQYSYPSQLQKILDQSSSSIHFEVINQGVGGAGSSILLQRMPQWLDNYHPDMVICMIGVIDGMQDKQPIAASSSPSFLKRIKLYWLFEKLKEKTDDALSNDLNKLKNRLHPQPPQPPLLTEYDMFVNAMKLQSNNQRQLYFLINLAKASNRLDIAEFLYGKFLQNNTDDLIHHWVIKQYGDLLVQRKEYDKFVSVMEYIPYNSWLYDWIPGYCHGEEHMEKVRQTIERMVTQESVDPLVYADVYSCYEEGGRPDLAQIYLQKMGSQSSYYNPLTRKNYLTIKELLLSHNIQPVFVQYPMRDIRPLLSIFNDDPDKDKIIFVDNGPSFQQAVRESSYETYFVDRMAGDIGHATPQGNHLLASNIAQAILTNTSKWEH